MEVEDFDDDDALTPAELIRRERAALGADPGLNSALPGRGAARPGAPSPLRGPAEPGPPAGRPGAAPLPRLGGGPLPALGGPLPALGGAAAPSPLPPVGGPAPSGPSRLPAVGAAAAELQALHLGTEGAQARAPEPFPPALDAGGGAGSLPATRTPSGVSGEPPGPRGPQGGGLVPLQGGPGPGGSGAGGGGSGSNSRRGPGLAPAAGTADPGGQQPQLQLQGQLAPAEAALPPPPPSLLPPPPGQQQPQQGQLAPLQQQQQFAQQQQQQQQFAQQVQPQQPQLQQGQLPPPPQQQGLPPQQFAGAPPAPLTQPPPPGPFGLAAAAAAADPSQPPPQPFQRPSQPAPFQQLQQQLQQQLPPPQQQQQQQQPLEGPGGVPYGGPDAAYNAAGGLVDPRLQGGGPPPPPDVSYAAYAPQYLTDVAPQQGDTGGMYDQGALWHAPFAHTFSLEELPEEGRYLHMDARQAERTLLELQTRGEAPRVVDILDVREKLLDASAPPRFAYLATVERAAPEGRLQINCRPSLLQTKVKSGQNKLKRLLEPTLEPGDQGFVDLSYGPDGALAPEAARVWGFGLSLVQADGVGKTGLQRVRAPCLYIARVALFDRRANRFLGNVLGVRPRGVSHYDKRWDFDSAERLIVRAGCVASDPQAGTRLVSEEALSVFVELNVSYRLSVEDTANMPQSEAKSAALLDEVNTCWAMISFQRCSGLTREVQISVPLYHGSIYDPQPMEAVYAEKRSKAPILSAFKAKENPVLQFRVGPLNSGKAPLVPYAYMPPTMVATHDLAAALAAYRMSLALTLGRQAGPFAAAADPVLAAFPRLLSDHHVLAEFLTKWRDITAKLVAIADVGGCCKPEVLPPLAALVEAFRRCVIELAPLTRCPTIPSRHINNFIEYQGHRLRLIQRYCHVMDPATNKILGARHPVEPLSHAGFEYLHEPFDVSEVRLCMADRLERPEPFYRH